MLLADRLRLFGGDLDGVVPDRRQRLGSAEHGRRRLEPVLCDRIEQSRAADQLGNWPRVERGGVVGPARFEVARLLFDGAGGETAARRGRHGRNHGGSRQGDSQSPGGRVGHVSSWTGRFGGLAFWSRFRAGLIPPVFFDQKPIPARPRATNHLIHWAASQRVMDPSRSKRPKAAAVSPRMDIDTSTLLTRLQLWPLGER